MIRFTAFIACSAAFALAFPAAASVSVPVTQSQATQPLSTLAARAKVSASLSETSFAVARVGSVKLRYRFSKPSTHFRYRLSLKSGSTWQTVNRVKKTGRFPGSHTVRVRKIFGAEPVKVGSYRLKLAADGGSTTVAFTVTSGPPAVVKPEAGLWHSTSLSGPYRHVGGDFSDSMEVTQFFFEVAPDRATLSKFGFSYTYSGPSFPSGELCSGSANSAASGPTPVTNGQFQDPGLPLGAELFRFQGTFDSPTTAHGTAQFGTTITDFRCRLSGFFLATGTFTWTATR